MNSQSSPVVKHLVLIGGGHAHALVIRMWAMKPVPGVRLTLISPNWQTPYSGMLPGLLAGHYTSDEIHIDLRQVCIWAKVRFIESHVLGLDTNKQTLELSLHPEIYYDTLSIDIGSTPDMSIPGLKEYAQAVKPIDQFYPRYLACIEHCQTKLKDKQQTFSIAIVGGGAGGIEVALAMAEKLANLQQQLSIKLVIRGQKILLGYPKKVAQACLSALKKNNIELITDFDVQRVEKNKIFAQSNSKKHEVEADEIFFCTQAIAADWPKKSGLDCDLRGFISVNKYLQTVNITNIFAAGDIANMLETPRPKAGVYAVRQAPVLLENLKRHLLKLPLKTYVPQDSFLSLLSLGEKKAIAAKRSYTLTSPFFQVLLWRLKNSIDMKFMSMFHELPTLDMFQTTKSAQTIIDPALIDQKERQQISQHKIRCAGCGGKIGSNTLRHVLSAVTGQKNFEPEDAATISTPTEQLLQTVDQITSPIDDPYTFGKIACLHAISDAFAMNATPSSVQVLLNLPYAASNIQKQEMTLVMTGLLEVLKQHNCQLVGGHTAEAKELSLGFVVNALVKPKATIFKKSALKAGDTLVLTKSIGTGVILAAQMQNLCRGEYYQSAIASMLNSNLNAAKLFASLNVMACTDVTGFGLAGHLCEMLAASCCKAEIKLSDIPILNGANELSYQGIKSSLYSQNEEVVSTLSINNAVINHKNYPLLFDPQTSGGLLAGLNPESLEALKAQQNIDYFILGKVTAENIEWDLEILA